VIGRIVTKGLEVGEKMHWDCTVKMGVGEVDEGDGRDERWNWSYCAWVMDGSMCTVDRKGSVDGQVGGGCV
jgi:hypothetical protein